MKQTILTSSIFAALVLLFTVSSLFVAPSSADVGGVRTLEAIPFHEAELFLVGLVLGVLSLSLYGRGGATTALLLPALVVMLDLDHLPVYIGVAQPIRPAHSLVFLAADVVLVTIVLMRLDFTLITVSAFMGHLGIDSGLAPLFSPLSFQYFRLDPYRIPMLAGCVIFCFSAGYLMRRVERQR